MSATSIRIVVPTTLLLVLFLGVSCRTDTQPAPTATRTPSATGTPRPTATATATEEPGPRGTPTLIGLTERPLAELSVAAAVYLASRPGPIAVAIAIPDRGTIYTANGDALFHTASVVKVSIMLTVMERAIQEKRALTDDELALFERMITESENDPADELWLALDEGAEVEAYIHSLGLTAFAAGGVGNWARSHATANELALLMAMLGGDEILNEPSRTLALDLMGRVVSGQRWGITAGAPSDAQIALKNGWIIVELPDGIWWVNSAGVVLPSAGRPAYSLAILTDQQATMKEGIETIAGIAARIHAALLEEHRPPTPTATPLSRPSGTPVKS